MATQGKRKGMGVSTKFEVSNEFNFPMGMNYTATTLDDGYANTLFNFRWSDQGTTLSPRRGMTDVEDPVELPNGVSTPGVPHASYFGTYTKNSLDTFDDIVISFGEEDDLVSYERATSKSHAWGVVDGLSYALDKEPGSEDILESVKFETFTTDPKSYLLHGLEFETNIKKPAFTVVNSRLYLLGTGFVDDGQGGGESKEGIYHMFIDQDNSQLRATRVEARDVNAQTATEMGFNMLKEEPYTFSNQEGGVFSPDAIIPYNPDDANDIWLTANIGDAIKFVVYYTYVGTDTYQTKWEYQQNGQDTWEVLKDFDASDVVSGGSELSHTFTPAHHRFALRITMRKGNDDTTAQVIPYPLYIVNNQDIKNDPKRNYDLNTATDILNYKFYTVLYGVEGAENTLFFSDVNDPTYFPFPHNIHTFEGKILAAFPYLSSLVVVTTAAMYVLNGDFPIEFTVRKIQEKLGLTSFDKTSVVVIKNLIYYRAGDHYYVAVPNVNVDEEANIIIKDITYEVMQTLFDNLDRYVKDIMNNAYFIDDFVYSTIVDYDVFVDNAEVKNIYRLKLHFGQYAPEDEAADEDGYIITDTANFTLVISYDTLMRAWRTEGFQLPSNATMYKAAYNSSMIYRCLLLDGDGKYNLQSIGYDAKEVPDSYVSIDRQFSNKQYLNSGIHSIVEYNRKRFKEIHYFFNNVTQTTVQLYTSFLIDGDVRQTAKSYSLEIDYQNDNVASLQPTYEYNITVGGGTALGESEDDYTAWTLDLSAFETNTVNKIRFPVSGKGYMPQMLLVADEERDFELMGYLYTYKTKQLR